jgi:hypothetical protein
VFLLAVEALDGEAVQAQRLGRSIQPRTVSSGIASSSGLNQEPACWSRANRIWTCWRFALTALSRWSWSYCSDGKYQTRYAS